MLWNQIPWRTKKLKILTKKVIFVFVSTCVCLFVCQTSTWRPQSEEFLSKMWVQRFNLLNLLFQIVQSSFLHLPKCSELRVPQQRSSWSGSPSEFSILGNTFEYSYWVIAIYLWMCAARKCYLRINLKKSISPKNIINNYEILLTTVSHFPIYNQ